MQWQRARRPEQKEVRRETILEAAGELFDELGLDQVSLSEIARRAEVSKANIYRYFENREEIFLHLLLAEQIEWVDEVERRLAPLAESGDIETLAAQLSESLTARPRLAALLASAQSVLERTVSVDAIVRFKRPMLDRAVRLANSIHAALPGLSIAKVQRFISLMHFVLIGIWPSAHPPAPLAEAMRRPEIGLPCVDYEADLREAMVVLLRGLRAS
ncbi:TetR family transcriptional regulator [Nannocystaceae bacterium ST9]